MKIQLKRILKIGLCFLWSMPAFLIYSCSDALEKTEPKPVVIISADKSSIKATNRDKVIFTVTVDGEEVTSTATITQKGKTAPVEGMCFSTDSAATYLFFATYKNSISNEISIEAIDIDVLLTVNKQTIKANNRDTVTFTIKADDEDVTSSATVIQMEDPDFGLPDSVFCTQTPGTYTFYAMYDGKKSNAVRVDASAISLTLSVDKTSIMANNSDKATFTVMADDENVTSSAVITWKRNRVEETLANNVFCTDEAATYSFYALYNKEISNEIQVEATYVELAFLRSYSIVQIASTICPNCPLMTAELIKIQQSLPGRIHVISLHPFGKYCNSDLAGALARTAISFADKANTLIPPPPLAIIDLYDPVNLYPTVTGIRITEALDRATRTRNWVSLTGMAVRSNVNDNRIDFEVGLKTKKSDKYRFFAFVVEDGVVHKQLLSDRTIDPNYVHNNLAIYQLTEGDPFRGIDLGTIWTGRETIRFFSINMNDFDTGRKVNLANCRIVCYTLRTNDGSNYFVDNVTSCPVNGSVSYLYEK